MNTLHPGIHAGFLADIHNEKHVEQIKNMSIHPIEVLVVNLYPFLWKVKLELNKDKILEFMDISTPVLLRAAARNYRNVVAISDISEYEKIISKWEGG